MGTIRKEVKLIGIRKSKNVTALFDTGAYRNYIKKELSDGEQIDSIGFHVYEGLHRVILADESEVDGEKVWFKELCINNLNVKEPKFIVMENLIEDIIIGVHLMQELGIRLNPRSKKIQVKS